MADTDDLSGDVRAAMAELRGDAPEPVVETAPEIQPAETAAEREERVRDESGRFARRETLTLAKPPEQVQSVDDQPETRQEPSGAIPPPPHSLKAAVKANWANYAPEVRAEFARIEEAAQAGKTEWASKAERLNRFDGLISPIKERLALAGTDEVTYLSRLIAADQMLSRDAHAGLAQIAQMYGLSPAQIGVQSQQAEHPDILALRTELSTLKQSLEQREHSERETRLSEARREIEAFKADHIYFEDVREDVKVLLESGRASTLEDAYDRAVWMNPEIRALVQKAERESDQTRTQRAQHAQKALSAGVSVTGSPAPGGKANGSVNPTATIQDDVRTALRELSGRA
jgi:hypothetical protein